MKNEKIHIETNKSKNMIDEQISPCCSVAKSMYDKYTVNENICCQDCQKSTTNCADGIYNSRPCIRRIGRKSRSRKTQYYHPAARTRSLSVGNDRSLFGNENNFQNNNGEASSGASGKERNDECLNNLRRNDLIDIIRESMEKSRQCFQSNG